MTTSQAAEPLRRSNDHVAAALQQGRAVVALESTIFSNLGLPTPYNSEALTRVLGAVRAGGSVPALTAVLDGVVWCGVPDGVEQIVCGPADKVAKRDLAPAIVRKTGYGATTVSASVAIAAASGVDVFATGGIGGVHRNWQSSRDVSADLAAIASHQVVTVSAGAKSFLDLPATLEELETLSVPVIGWRTDEFPAFYAKSSGLTLNAVAESVDDLAQVARTHWALGGGGLLVVNPVPDDHAIELEELDQWTAEALRLEGLSPAAQSDEALIDRKPSNVELAGPSVTPRVLARLVELSDGRTLEANLALAESNAAVAAELAVAMRSVD